MQIHFCTVNTRFFSFFYCMYFYCIYLCIGLLYIVHTNHVTSCSCKNVAGLYFDGFCYYVMYNIHNLHAIFF